MKDSEIEPDLDNEVELDLEDKEEDASGDESDKDKEVESNKNDLDFLDTPDETEQEKTIRTQAEKATQSIESGAINKKTKKPYVASDFPDYLQSKLEGVESPKAEIDKDSIIAEATEAAIKAIEGKATKKEVAGAIKEIKTQMSEMEMSAEEMAGFKAEFKELRSDGVRSDKAAKNALKMVNAQRGIEGQEVAKNLSQMGGGKSGSVNRFSPKQGKTPADMNDDEFLKWGDDQAKKQRK
jgi:hypothetical protein